MRSSLERIREFVRSSFKRIPQGPSDNETISFHCIRELLSMARRAYDLFTAAKREAHKLDYDDLIQQCYELLKQPSSAARKLFNQELTAVLVDEFQDTNP